MKNFFSSLIEKAKSFVTSLTPASKIKYIVITVLTVTVAASFLVVVSLNTNEPEAPTNPEGFATGETATIDFDNEIIFDVSGTSSDSTAIEGTESSSGTSDESSNITTDDDTSSKETPDKPDESTSKDEPQPTDPSQTNNDDPEPVITTPVQTTNDPQTEPKPTESTTKKPQTEPKPTEATTKTPQTEPKPMETTTKTPQTEPKPTETTTKAPQTEPKPTETTKPQESTPQPAGQFSLKEKTYDYNGANVSILQVENKSEQAYTITITGKFKDSNGKVIKTESKTFEGFPGGWSNYFVFQPGVKYTNVTWGMDTVEFTGETLAQHIHPADKVVVECMSGLSDGSGNFVVPSSPDDIAKCKKYVTIWCTFKNMFFQSNFTGLMDIRDELVVFDNNGNLIFVGSPGTNTNISYTTEIFGDMMPMFVTDVLWENKDNYKLPDKYKNATGIMAIVSVTRP